MPTPPVDAGVEMALRSGRSVIVPNAQRATALRLAWARVRIAAGETAWPTPDILTWDVWLAREWRTHGRGQPLLSLLSRSQEIQLWEQVLDSLQAASPDPQINLAAHATAIAQAAARVTQSQIPLDRAVSTEEELLLALAVRSFRQLCVQRGWLAVSVAEADQFQPLPSAVPPLIAHATLTPLQIRLAAQCWPDEQLLAPVVPPASTPQCVQALDWQSEVQAVAQWCKRHLAEDGSRRLLVVTASGEPPIRVMAQLLWRQLSANTSAETAANIDPAWLSVEGGEPLTKHRLIAGALGALACINSPVETEQLLRLLQNPYFAFGGLQDTASLDLSLRKLGARCTLDQLQRALEILAETEPAASRFAQWLKQLRELGAEPIRRSAADWAAGFDRVLSAGGFPGARVADSLDAQRFVRWRELLDELASLDAVMPKSTVADALRQLGALARRATHEAASADAAITVTAYRGDPLIRYDGIWVMGLAEQAWPEAPRPNPFVPLSEQRRALWPESSARLRLQQAEEELSGWRARTSDLILSYAQRDGDLHRRPSVLLTALAPRWIATTYTPLWKSGAFPAIETDTRLPTLATASGESHELRAGTRFLELQQQCGFRAQAELRLGARQLEVPSHGIDPRLRGQLLHGLLEELWREIKDQQRLQSMSMARRHSAIAQAWCATAERLLRDRIVVLDARVLRRERIRTEGLVLRTLELEAQRPPFTVESTEQRVPLAIGQAGVTLRVDRVDKLTDGQRLIIDYKTGQTDSAKLDDELPRPVQLLAYFAALTSGQSTVSAMGLLALQPGNIHFTGAGDKTFDWPKGIKPTDNWRALEAAWQSELARLARDFLAGDARVLPIAGVCRTCHLRLLCRVARQETDDE
jgi:ATP-dependent helicase/nuclease subunit B